MLFDSPFQCRLLCTHLEMLCIFPLKYARLAYFEAEPPLNDVRLALVSLAYTRCGYVTGDWSFSKKNLAGSLLRERALCIT